MNFFSGATLSTDTFSICDSRCLRCASSWATRSWASTTCFSCESFARASCKPYEQNQWSWLWEGTATVISRTKYTVDPSKATGIIPGIISLYHSECLEFAGAVSLLYARPVLVPRWILLVLFPSRLQTIPFRRTGTTVRGVRWQDEFLRGLAVEEAGIGQSVRSMPLSGTDRARVPVRVGIRPWDPSKIGSVESTAGASRVFH